MMGLEPTTLGTTNRCSNQLSYIYRFGECKCKYLLSKVKRFFNITIVLLFFLAHVLIIDEICSYGRAIS